MPASRDLQALGLVRTNIAISAVRPREFAEMDVGVGDENRRFIEDCAKQFGVSVDMSRYDEGRRLDFTAMTRAMAPEIGQLQQRPDLVLVASAAPDLRFDSFPGPALAHELDASPTVLGVTQQGSSAAFTALSIISAYVSDGDAASACLLLFDLSTCPYPMDAAGDTSDTDAAVHIVVTARGTGRGLMLGQWRGVDGRDASRMVDRVIETVQRPGRAIKAFISAHVDSGLALDRLGPQRSPAGQPTTGVWRVLADSNVEEERVNDVIVVNLDKELATLSIALLEGAVEHAHVSS